MGVVSQYTSRTLSHRPLSVITWGRERALQQLAEEEGEETATEE